jgi:restriction system protein
LLVSWGGYRGKVRDEARNSFFAVRLWDSGDLIEALFQHYDKPSANLQAEISNLNLRG